MISGCEFSVRISGSLKERVRVSCPRNSIRFTGKELRVDKVVNSLDPKSDAVTITGKDAVIHAAIKRAISTLAIDTWKNREKCSNKHIPHLGICRS